MTNYVFVYVILVSAFETFALFFMLESDLKTRLQSETVSNTKENHLRGHHPKWNSIIHVIYWHQ